VTSASTASAATTITTTIENVRIFCTSELRPDRLRVSEVVHKPRFLWIAGS
jgi:hypothetical protein